MVRTDSIYKTEHARNPGMIRSLSSRRLYRPKAGLCLIGVVLAWSACGNAASGPGLAFKAGVQTLEDPIDLDKTTRVRLEVELSTARFFDDHFDVAFAFGGSSLGSFSETYTDYVDGVFIKDTYTDDLAVLDVRLAARLYPLGDASEVRPYIGAGIGYFWLLDSWHDTYTDTIQDPLFPDVWYTYSDRQEGTDTPANGFFSFVTAGATLPIGSHSELIFEFQYDFAKEDNGFDLGGPIYMIGGRFRF